MAELRLEHDGRLGVGGSLPPEHELRTSPLHGLQNRNSHAMKAVGGQCRTNLGTWAPSRVFLSHIRLTFSSSAQGIQRQTPVSFSGRTIWLMLWLIKEEESHPTESLLFFYPGPRASTSHEKAERP